MRWLLTTILLTVTFISQAEIVKPVMNNSDVTAPIAQNGITRIGVMGDHIQQTIGSYKGNNKNDVYNLQADSQTGNIFITPEQTTPFTLQLRTEAGKYYTLHLYPKNMQPKAIILLPQNYEQMIQKNNVKALPYTISISQLIRLMVNNQLSSKFAIENVKSKPKKFGSVATLQLAKTYQGKNLTGKIYLFKNISNISLHIQEKQFIKPNIAAISIALRTVKPKSSTWIYEVAYHG